MISILYHVFFVMKKNENTKSFFRTGIAVMAIMLISSIAIAASQQRLENGTPTLSQGLISDKKLPIYCVDTKEPQIALSFDAAWGNDDTQKIIDILKKNEVKATFFMTGGWVDSYPEDVKMIAKEGHELGNHSQNHKQMSTLSKQECQTEIMTPHQKVKELTGIDMKVFRPPYGDYNDTLIEAVQTCNYHAIQWDVDSLDWKDYGVDSIIRTVTEHKHLGNGSIILCHNGAKYTAQALDELIQQLKDKGYQFVTVSELIYDGDSTIDVEGRQHKSSEEKQE